MIDTAADWFFGTVFVVLGLVFAVLAWRVGTGRPLPRRLARRSPGAYVILGLAALALGIRHIVELV